MTDTERLNWLDTDNTRLEDVRGRMNNEDETVREAIDALTAMTNDKRLNKLSRIQRRRTDCP